MGKKVFLERYNHKKLAWLHDLLIFIAMVVAVFVAFKFIIGISHVSGDSMNPTLQDGEIVIYLRTAKDYKAGDIVSIWVPSGEYYVKRVIAVGGDTVNIVDGKVYVNDELIENTFDTGDTLREDGTVIYPYKVREDNVFVLGDNRTVSVDSRAFGEVNLVQIRGKLLWKMDGIRIIGVR